MASSPLDRSESGPALPLPFAAVLVASFQASGRKDGNALGGGDGETVGYRLGSRAGRTLVAGSEARFDGATSSSLSSDDELESLSLSESLELESLSESELELLELPELLLLDSDSLTEGSPVLCAAFAGLIGLEEDDDEEEELELAGEGDRAANKRQS